MLKETNEEIKAKISVDLSIVTVLWRKKNKKIISHLEKPLLDFDFNFFIVFIA